MRKGCRDDGGRRAVMFLMLVRLKPYASLTEIETLVREVTGYDPEEIALFIKRAKEGHLIDDKGQPDPCAYAVAETAQDPDDIPWS